MGSFYSTSRKWTWCFWFVCRKSSLNMKVSRYTSGLAGSSARKFDDEDWDEESHNYSWLKLMVFRLALLFFWTLKDRPCDSKSMCLLTGCYNTKFSLRGSASVVMKKALVPNHRTHLGVQQCPSGLAQVNNTWPKGNGYRSQSLTSRCLLI